MTPRYKHYEDLMKGRIDRRTFIKRAAAAGAATPLIENWLTQPAAASYLPASHNHFSLTRAAAQSATLAPPAEGIDTSQALVFRGWNYLPEVVQDNTNTFNESTAKTSTTRRLRAITLHMENSQSRTSRLTWPMRTPLRLLAGSARLDSRLRGLVGRRRRPRRNLRRSPPVATIGDKLYGLPYFVSIRGTLAANMAVLDKAGITAADFPKTWNDLYAQLRQLKATV